ncbi:MBL fold metallo-hydrolase [Candidatus Bathyarchaeota archaeon]|nr:MBL fold metallo-hydrolase [Candidatus Bathyarchaeota archaeon]MBS7630775.1 MBL fold metallo-hydrolase [Candidatus Bathyarchaeota archaeon]
MHLKQFGDICQFKIPLIRNPLKYTLTYFIKSQNTLIDLGGESEEAKDALKRQLLAADSSLSKIEKVVLTHLHRDHSGLTNYLKENSNATIYTHYVSRNYSIENNDLKELILKEFYMFGENSIIFPKIILHQIQNKSSSRSEAYVSLNDNDYLDSDKRFQVIWTPGHAPEHICIYDNQLKILFSGDHVLPRITPHISLHINEKTNPLKDYIESLEKIKKLDIKLVLPAHESEFKDLEKRVEGIEKHHLSRLEEIKDTVRKGEKTVHQISSELSWKSSPWGFMPFWIKHMAACETYAHLIYLRNRGDIYESIKNGRLYYKI